MFIVKIGQGGVRCVEPAAAFMGCSCMFPSGFDLYIKPLDL